MKRRPSVAITGIGGIFPQAPDLASFWSNIAANVSTPREIPEGRWPVSLDDVYDPTIGAPDKVNSRRGCFIEGFSLDLDGAPLVPSFEIAPDLDPLFHLTLHAGVKAFADANMTLVDRRRVGVVLGSIALPTASASEMAREWLGCTFEEKLLGNRARRPHRVQPLNRLVCGFPAALLARALGLGLGGYTVDAACASSLYALKLAVDELVTGRADAMLTGGVCRADSLYTQMGFSQLRAISPSGLCSPFDARADGLVVGEGAGVLVLRRLEDALNSGDRIYGVIHGIGLSNDIGGSLLAPLSEGQLRAMRSAYAQAEWDPASVDLVECHATGTPVGDAVEFESLKTLWGEDGWRAGQCAIGSVKSNVGHLLTGAGAAALIKVLLALREKQRPPSANFSRPLPNLNMEASPFRVLTNPEAWDRRGAEVPRRAAVSAFGFGGVNAHVLLEEWKDAPRVSVAFPAETKRSGEATPVAVVGMAAHFGPWRSLRRFQERVLGADNAAEPTENPRWWGIEESAWYREQRGSGAPIKGFFLDDVPVRLDRFRVPPKELEEMLPQQLLLLDAAADAVEDAGMTGKDNVRTGVFAGIALDMNTTNFALRWSLPRFAAAWAHALGFDLSEDELDDWIRELRDAAGPPLTANRTMGALGSVAASRVAREFRCGASSFTLSSGETSGLRALAAAVQALRDDDIDCAIVGAVDVAGEARAAIGASILRGPENSEAILLGEGVGAVVLKRIEDALRDGDRVYATIKEIGCAGCALEETGALADAEKDAYCALGSANADIGDAGAASGMASFIKSCLALYQEILPPQRGLLAENGPFRAHTTPAYWLRNRAEGPRRAAVSACAVGGDYVHVLLEASEEAASNADATERLQPLGARDEALFVAEANNAAALSVELSRLRAHAEHAAEMGIEALARAWWKQNRGDPQKLLAATFVARDAAELVNQVACVQQWTEENPARRLAAQEGQPLPLYVRDRVFYSPDPIGKTGKLAFVYPGSGNDYTDMGRDIAIEWPEVYRAQEAHNLFLRDQFQPGQYWDAASSREEDADHRTAIFAQVALGTAVTDLFQMFGPRCDAAIGYSLGESAGLFALRAWTDRDEMLRRMNASTLFTTDLAGRYDAARKTWGLPPSKTVDWVLGVINRPSKVVLAAIKDRKRVYQLIVNTLQESVVGGDRNAVERLVRKLECEFFPLPAGSSVHCEVARLVETPYRELHLFDTTPPKDVAFYSGATGRHYRVTRESAADAILAQAVHGVDFPKVIDAAYKDGVRCFIEMGPGASCSRMIASILEGRPHVARSACLQGQSAVSSVLRALAQLIAERVPVALNALYGQETSVPAHGAGVSTAPALTVRIAGDAFAPPMPEPRVRLLHETPAPRDTHRVLPHSDAVVIGTGGGTAAWTSLVQDVAAAQDAAGEAHAAYLRFADRMQAAMAESLALQMSLIGAMGAGQDVPIAPVAAPAFDRSKCMEFAIGKTGAMLGAEFSEVDTYPTRVRLPDEPLMLVDRIVSVEGEPRSMTQGRVITEHDVLPGAWYLDGGKIPTCIAVEAGQADLFLSGYLGIDFITKGLAMYRLLDADVTFHRGLPGPGAVIRYDIRILRFFRQGDTHLFRFEFDGTVAGEPLLTMRGGCAGFFTKEQLDAGRGVVLKSRARDTSRGTLPPDWETFVPMSAESYSDAQLDALRSGDLAGCFGAAFRRLALREPMRLPSGRMKLVHRIVSLEPEGGTYGLGLIRGEADVHPDDWFLTCHFIDDQVMPGTLMYECCLHTLRVFLMRLGWVGENGETVCEPVAGVTSKLKCRGQVIASTRKVIYEIIVKELGYNPAPYAIANAIMYADGKPVVDIGDMCVQFTGLTRETIRRVWASRRGAVQDEETPRAFDHASILNFCDGGPPSKTFGERYRVFDRGRFIARLPRDPYQLIHRVFPLNAEPWKMAAGGVIHAEYDVPPDAWYFAGDRQECMPFAVLLEIALQPCGWFAAYMGSALSSETDLRFRNLGGSAMQSSRVGRNAETLRTEVCVTSVSQSAGMIIQHFRFAVRAAGGAAVYDGDTYFGFFSPETLANQVGIREAALYAPAPAELERSRSFDYPSSPPFPDERLRMLDRIDVYAGEGGPHGMGFVRGSKRVNPDEWFFHAHFFEDPVWPGSLGVEAFLQLLKAASAERWALAPGTQFESAALNVKHTWAYRGQVIPANKLVSVEASITKADNAQRLLQADGFLSVDGLTIYQMSDFAIRML